jgi:hypothetical protein
MLFLEADEHLESSFEPLIDGRGPDSSDHGQCQQLVFVVDVLGTELGFRIHLVAAADSAVGAIALQVCLPPSPGHRISSVLLCTTICFACTTERCMCLDASGDTGT